MDNAHNFHDPRWRLNHLYFIKNKQRVTNKFKENNIQWKINNCTANRKIILKARQFGVSTNEILKAFDKTIFNANYTTCILAHENDALKKLFQIPWFAYNHMNPLLKPVLDKGGGSRYEMRFPEINSKIYVDLESRGETIQHLHVSEVAFMKDKSRLDATLESVPLDGHITLETTPNGMNFFYDMWIDKDFPYEKLFFPWYMFDEYRYEGVNVAEIDDDEKKLIKYAKEKYKINIDKSQLAFKRMKEKQLNEKFDQEYPKDDVTCFLSSGNPFFNLNIVKERLMQMRTYSFHTTTQIFEECNVQHRYVCGADTAEGIGGDFSAASIYCVDTKRQVAALRGDWKPSEYANELYKLCEKFKHKGEVMPLLAVERNNHGHAVLLELKEHLKYNNIFKDSDGRDGWLTNNVSKPIMLNGYKDFLESMPQNIKCKHALTECLTFINNNGKLGAIQGKHDDTVVANAIAIQILIKEASYTDWNRLTEDFKTFGGNFG